MPDSSPPAILLVRHSYGPQHWALPGGGLASGEDAEACARRELREELGLAGTLPFFQYQTYVDQAAQSERAVLLRRLGVISAQLALEETVGAPLRP